MPMNNRLLRPRAKGGFDPKSITGLALWLDGASLASGSVATWSDKSGNGRDATQTTGNNQPTTTTVNGRNAVSFDGSNDRMAISFTYSASNTLFVVCSPASTINKFLFGPGAPGVVISGYGNAYEWYSNNGQDRLVFAASASGQNVLTMTQVDGGLLQIFFNGTSAATKNPAINSLNGDTITTIGNATDTTGGYDGVMCEILAYNVVLSAANRQAVERYLGKKWNITVA